MTVQPIRLFGDPVLRTPAEPVTVFDKELRRLVADLTETMIDAPGAKASRVRALQSVFIHHMLVDQAFTMEAGRTIWGFPKVLADFTIRDGDQFGFDVEARLS